MPKGRQSKNRKNSICIIEERRTQIMELYLTGLSQEEIARELGCCVATVSNDIAKIRERWDARAIKNTDLKIREEYEYLQNLYKQCMYDYHKSKAVIVGTPGDKRIEYTGKGDVKYISEARSIRSQMHKLLGLVSSDTKINVNQNNGVQVVKVDWGEMYSSMEEEYDDPVDNLVETVRTIDAVELEAHKE